MFPAAVNLLFLEGTVWVCCLENSLKVIDGHQFKKKEESINIKDHI